MDDAAAHNTPTALTAIPTNAAGVPICNARRKNPKEGQPATCQHVQGFRTDHPGSGRCYLHGGRGGRPIKHGRYSTKLNSTLGARIEEFVHSPELLSLDREVALIKTLIEMQVQDFSRYITEREQYEALMKQWIPENENDKPPTPPRIVEVDKETLKLATIAVKTANEMRFSKRFSVPIAEVHAAMQQVAVAFNEICNAYNIPDEAKRAFGDRLRNVKLSKSGPDEQLWRAGMGANSNALDDIPMADDDEFDSDDDIDEFDEADLDL